VLILKRYAETSRFNYSYLDCSFDHNRPTKYRPTFRPTAQCATESVATHQQICVEQSNLGRQRPRLDCSTQICWCVATLSVVHCAVGLNVGRYFVGLVWSNETQCTVMATDWPPLIGHHSLQFVVPARVPAHRIPVRIRVLCRGPDRPPADQHRPSGCWGAEIE
jgi:hypothetical protein